MPQDRGVDGRAPFIMPFAKIFNGRALIVAQDEELTPPVVIDGGFDVEAAT